MIRSIVFFPLLFSILTTGAQMITGTWKGKINRQKTELKIIQNGDSLTGTSYYYESPSNYRRYSIKGYFDPLTNAAVWWDDQLIDEKTGRINLTAPGKNALLSKADFNCPGGDKMMLDGKAARKEEGDKPDGEVHLYKVTTPVFRDEWDFVIENYTTGTNDPELIDRIAQLTQRPIAPEEASNTLHPESPGKNVTTKTGSSAEKTKPVAKVIPASLPPKKTPVVPTIEEKFVTREKVLIKEIPVTGDSIELRFYDNAEIDGDSISLFLNDQLIFQHIRLTGLAYTIKLAVRELKETNELIMVAENLGTIPPNTSYMVAIIGDNRYDARLESTEGSSAMVRFVKKSGSQ